MLVNCDVIVIFLNNGQFGASQKLDSKLTFSVRVNFYLTKTENRTKKPLTQLSYCYYLLVNDYTIIIFSYYY